MRKIETRPVRSRHSANPRPGGSRRDTDRFSLFDTFSRREWAALGADQFDLTTEVLAELRGIDDPISLSEALEVFGPLSRLVNLRLEAARSSATAVERAMFGREPRVTPFIVGIAGSVAVGKSTFSRILRTVLAGGAVPRTVELVATDGFLFPTETLQQKSLMARKGFPETYDLRRLLRFLADLKAGAPSLEVPVYSHERYDIVEGEFQTVRQPDILIFEGLNVLQTAGETAVVASDFIDLAIYIDADPSAVEAWYVERFASLQATVFQRPNSYFHHYKDLPPEESRAVARSIWQGTNLPNLTQNIRPTRERADVIIRKGESHAVDEIWLRRRLK